MQKNDKSQFDILADRIISWIKKHTSLTDRNLRNTINSVCFILDSIMLIICMLNNGNISAINGIIIAGSILCFLSYVAAGFFILYGKLFETERDKVLTIIIIAIAMAICILMDCGFHGGVVDDVDYVLVGICLLCISLWDIYFIIRCFFSSIFNYEIKPMLLTSIAIFCFLLSAVCKDFSYKNSVIFLKCGVGIVYLVLVSIFVNVFLNSGLKRYKISKTISAIAWSLAILISFPYYILWCGVNGESFNVFVNVYASLVGGGITLVGVAWTIRKGDRDRADDRKQLEEDRKEDDRRRRIPYLTINSCPPQSQYAVTVKDFESIKNDNDFINNSGVKYSYNHIGVFWVRNVSKSNVVFRGIKVHNTDLSFSTAALLPKDNVIQINICPFPIVLNRTIDKVELIVDDELGNEYEVSCHVRFERTSEFGQNHECSCSLYIESLGLPTLKR